VRVLSSCPSGQDLAAVFFFFVATLTAGSTWWAMPAMAAPPAGAADACEAKVNETADAAARANKVIFMYFLPTIFASVRTTDAPEMARPPSEPVLSTSRFGWWCALAKIRTANRAGAHEVRNLHCEAYRNFSAEQVALIFPRFARQRKMFMRA
jgi:hypothetical protein